MKLLRKVYPLFKETKNIVSMDVPVQGKVTIVGDTHGQLSDLLYILDNSGMPSDKNRYVFNGDFVDRGPNGVEVACILFALYVSCPNNVILLRGNHEDGPVTRVYGFQEEVTSKYDDLVFGMFAEVFRYLPLFGVVDGSIFIVHGGLFNHKGVHLKDLEKIDRSDYIAKPPVPYPANVEKATADEKWKEYYRQLQRDALWSDPQLEPGQCLLSTGSRDWRSKDEKIEIEQKRI